MPLLDFIRPHFWSHESGPDPARSLFNYRRAWGLAIVLTALSALVPLMSMAIIDYKVTKSAVESEVRLRTSRIVSNARRAVSFYLAERISALRFVTEDRSYDELRSTEHLGLLLEHLRKSHGGFIDLGVIGEDGVQSQYAGPYNLQGRNYSNQNWFEQVLTEGSYVSEVFLGFRNVPHLVVAVRHDMPNGGYYVLRATLDTERFNHLAKLDMVSGGDSFIINTQGVLQTPSVYYGDVLTPAGLPVPPVSDHTEMFTDTHDGREIIVGYAYVPNSSFVLMVVKRQSELLASWYETRLQLLWFLSTSVAGILVVLTAVATYLVNRVYIADRNRAAALHHAEHSNKMASIGRLAAGVAHEINNPLAVIGEKSGLLKDLLTYQRDKVDPERIMTLANEIAGSVERCGNITKHLLGFARHISVKVERIRIREIIEEILSFLSKEAEYRSVTISVHVPDAVPEFECDRGKLQQILLNLVNNAFQAVSDHGSVAIDVTMPDEEHLSIVVRDDGCGIAEKDRKRIFEPFFSTKHNEGGTGLGLSITYGLVRKLGGSIAVSSVVGEGTEFTITLPLACRPGEEEVPCEYC